MKITIPLRFRGKAGHARLVRVLRAQKIAADDGALAQKLAVAATVFTVYPTKDKSEFISQGELTSDIFLIISGKVAVRVKRTQVATRGPGDHVGEMALIDPQHTRSASVIALERTEVAKIGEQAFSELADKHPEMWRRLAIELGNRLRQRSEGIRSPNKLPIVFIGSAGEQRKVVDNIAKTLKSSSNIKVKKWTKGVFGLSATVIESLEKVITSADFAILLFSGDDAVISRGKPSVRPRDNCVFELGLAMGALGRDRTFIFKEDKAIHLPSDLSGVTYQPYKATRASIQAATKMVMAKIKELKSK